VIEITEEPISPELVVNKIKTDSSGCVVTYVGLIRKLQKIASEIRQKWPINNLAICHRIGKLEVGDINLVVAIASAHRREGFDACQYAIDQFKRRLPTQKRETYEDGSIWVEGE